MKALGEEKHQAQVSAVADMASLLPSSGRDPSFARRLMNCAEAIAGLASGRQHLSSPQFEELIHAAGRLEAACELAGKYATDHEKRLQNETLAAALFGLAAA